MLFLYPDVLSPRREIMFLKNPRQHGLEPNPFLELTKISNFFNEALSHPLFLSLNAFLGAFFSSLSGVFNMNLMILMFFILRARMGLVNGKTCGLSFW